MRLIDADKFEAFVIRTNGDEEFVNGVQYVLEKIDNAPTVDAVYIPENATNGDVIKALFPDYTYVGTCVLDKNENILLHDINYNWWLAPYKENNHDINM